jgi:hypothetical protein
MDISTFASKLFEARDTLHIYHIKTDSYSAHKALGSYYEAVIDFADSFLEAYKGFTGDFNFDKITIEQSALTNPIFYIEDFVGTVLMAAKEELAGDMNTYGFLVNEIETLIFESYRTIYKLKFLK